jgi:hypothetical protein
MLFSKYYFIFKFIIISIIIILIKCTSSPTPTPMQTPTLSEPILCPYYSTTNTNYSLQNYLICNIYACSGSTIIISGCGEGTCLNGNDQYIRLYDSSNTMIAFDDDSCGYCSQITLYLTQPCQSYSIHQGCYSSSACHGNITVFGSINFPPTPSPTTNPTYTLNSPTPMPSFTPTLNPTILPTAIPTFLPTLIPTFLPSIIPTPIPTEVENVPTRLPTAMPTYKPTKNPTTNLDPTAFPTFLKPPTTLPTSQPSSNPTMPSSQPTSTPSGQPSSLPTSMPSTLPYLSTTELASTIIISIFGFVVILIFFPFCIYNTYYKNNKRNTRLPVEYLQKIELNSKNKKKNQM